MVKLALVRSANKTLTNTHPLVAVFPGGTSGIGEYAVRALATTHGKDGKGLRLYIAGRNQSAAEKIIADCQTVCPSGQFRFVQAQDLSLLKDVDRVSNEIIKLEEAEAKAAGTTPRIDILVMTQGVLDFKPRNETKEGLDDRMSLLYYSRIRFILNLHPLLTSSPLPTGAHAISVFGPTRDAALHQDDLSLRHPGRYGLMIQGSHVAYLKTFLFERLAADNKGKLSLVHYFPNLVWTNGFSYPGLPGWFRWVFRAFGPVLRLAMVPEGECGERVLYLASGRYPARSETEIPKGSKTEGGVEIATSSDGIVGGGAYRVDWDDEEVPLKKTYPELRAGGFAQKAYDHTMEAFGAIDAGRVFKN